MCSFGSTEFNLYSVRHSKAAIGSFITRIFAELCIILREINHPLTDGLCIISWRTNSVGQYTESRRLYSLLLGMEYGWSTSSAMYYTSDRARTLVAREGVLRLLRLLIHLTMEQIPFAVRQNRKISSDDILHIFGKPPVLWSEVDR